MRRVLSLLALTLALASCGDPELVAPRLSVSEVQGAGRVVSVPEGIDCPGRCEAWFAEGTSVLLVAEPLDPEAGLESCLFVDHADVACGGACSKSCPVMMGPDRSVRAVFE